MQATRRIIKEVGDEFGLTPQESLLMYDQYWMEFVMKNLSRLKYISVVVLGLGSFFLKQKAAERYIANVNSELPEKKGSLGYLVDSLKKRNESFKRKRIYG